MLSYADKTLFRNQSHDKTLSLTGTNISINNSNIRKEECELEEVLNSENYLNFGECNAHKLTVTVGYYSKSIAGKTITANITPDGGAALPYGVFKVLSDFPTADRRFRKIVMMDKLYDILKMDVTAWYNTQLPDTNTTKTIKQLRDSFFSYVGVTQDTKNLPNDSISVTRTIEPSNLTGKTVLNKICQGNGCYGRIGRNGNFQYVFLEVPKEGLFPSETLYPANDLYPKAYGFENHKAYRNGTYIKCTYENYTTSLINKVIINDAENHAAGSAGTGNNALIISDNFLFFGKETAELNTIASHILNKVGGLWFRPAEIEAVAEPWIECGDGILVKTVEGLDVHTYLLSRKIKGIQALFDYISSDCLEKRPNDGNTMSEQINQLKGNENRIEADLIQAKKVIAEEIQADRARIGQLEADMIAVNQLVATKASIQDLNAVDAKIDNLTAIAITTQNLSAQTISGNQISGGTIGGVNINALAVSCTNVDSNGFTFRGTPCKWMTLLSGETVIGPDTPI